MRFSTRAIIKNSASNKILFIRYLDLKSIATKEFDNGFWVLPGGGVERGESFVDALTREIFEETGITRLSIKNCVLSRLIYLDISTCENDLFYERYYLVETDEEDININNLSENETNVIKEYKWWLPDEIKKTEEDILPQSFSRYIDEIMENPIKSTDITDVEKILLL